MKMRFSGWVRLWLVVAVAWWAAGAWWLTSAYEPVYTRIVLQNDAGKPFIRPEALERKHRAEIAMWNVRVQRPAPAASDATAFEKSLADSALSSFELRNAMATAAAEAPFTEADYLATSREDRSGWLLALSFVVLAPFLAALATAVLTAIAGWVIRGFRPGRASA